jgi:hypothetical protein
MSFYMYAYASLPSTPPTNMWYATWTNTSGCVEWSQTKPTKIPDDSTSWVVGVVDEATCPTGASTLSSGGTGKSMPPAPPIHANSMPTFESAFDVWANGVKSLGDLAE